MTSQNATTTLNRSHLCSPRRQGSRLPPLSKTTFTHQALRESLRLLPEQPDELASMWHADIRRAVTVGACGTLDEMILQKGSITPRRIELLVVLRREQPRDHSRSINALANRHARASRPRPRTKKARLRGLFSWSEWQDSNLRPPRPERGALPDCATLRDQRRLYRPADFVVQAGKCENRHRRPRLSQPRGARLKVLRGGSGGVRAGGVARRHQGQEKNRGARGVIPSRQE